MPKRFAKVILLTIGMVACWTSVIAQAPCTDEDAYRTAGSWRRQRADDLGSADPTFPKTDYPRVLSKAQKIVELLKNTTPAPPGIEAYAKRSIRGRPIVLGGPVPFGVTAGYFDYICMADREGVAGRGKVLSGVETDTWIEFDFNSLSWLTNDSASLGPKLRTADGRKIYFAPKESGEFKGQRLFRSDVHKLAEAIIITAENRSPFVPVTREEFVNVRIADFRNEIATAKGIAQAVKYYEGEIAKLNRNLQSMSAAERSMPASIRSGFAPPDQLFVEESKGGKRIVTIDHRLFESVGSRDAIRVITLYWRWNEKDPAKAALIREFKEKFDLNKLCEMLGK